MFFVAFVSSKSSLRVPRAETWLTVYRPLQVEHFNGKVTRRNGVSSCRVICFLAADMFSGKRGSNFSDGGGLEMTGREGAPTSNFKSPRGRWAPKCTVTQMHAWRSKFNIARDFTCRFSISQLNALEFFIANALVTSTRHKQFVFELFPI